MPDPCIVSGKFQFCSLFAMQLVAKNTETGCTYGKYMETSELHLTGVNHYFAVCVPQTVQLCSLSSCAASRLGRAEFTTHTRSHVTCMFLPLKVAA